MSDLTKFQTIVSNAGKSRVADVCKVSKSNVTRWYKNGKLPDSDYLPKDHESRTNYAAAIAKLAKCKRKELL